MNTKPVLRTKNKMKSNKILRNFQVIFLGICIVVAIVLSSIIISRCFLNVTKFTHEHITVTGAAHKFIKSNYIMWTCTLSRRENTLPAAYKRLKDDITKVKEYLVSKGIVNSEITIPQIVTEVIYKKNEQGNNTNDVDGYSLTQNIWISSERVDQVTQISRESTELINQGLEFISRSPEYIYTELDDLKVEILAQASENARKRAETIAKATGSKIESIRSAKMGVFQITPVYSTEVSDYGINDTSSLDKQVTAVVTVTFTIK